MLGTVDRAKVSALSRAFFDPIDSEALLFEFERVAKQYIAAMSFNGEPLFLKQMLGVTEDLRSAVEAERYGVVLRAEVDTDRHVDIGGVMQTAFETMKFSDMNIVAQGRVEIPCHRVVLSAVSQVFDCMLSHEMHEGTASRVELTDVPARAVRNFLECIYTATIPSDLNFTDVEALFWLADKYQVTPLAKKCANLLCACVSESTVVSVSRILGQVAHTNDMYQDAFDTVMKMVQEDVALLKVVFLMASTHPSGVIKHESSPSDGGAQAVKSGEESSTPCANSGATTFTQETVSAGTDASSSFHGEPQSSTKPKPGENRGVPIVEEAEEVDEEKQSVVLTSLNEAKEEEDAALARALLNSKHDAPTTLSCDGVVILRLTRKARSREVHDALTTSPTLARCHKRVEDAGCSLSPDWASGARLFVPLTQEQLEESGRQLADHHVIALASDLEDIKAALRQIKFKDRPKVTLDYSAGDNAHQTVGTDPAGDAPTRNIAEEDPSSSSIGNEGGMDNSDDDGFVDVVLEYTYTPTDSGFGFPENSHTGMQRTYQ